MSIIKGLRSSVRNFGSKGFSRKEHTESEPRSLDETIVEKLIFGPIESGSPDLEARAGQSRGAKRAFAEKACSESQSRSWNESAVETLIFGASESTSPDLQAVARQSTGSKRASSWKGQSEAQPGTLAESTADTIIGARVSGVADGRERAQDLEAGLQVPMRKSFVLRLPQESADVSFKGTLLSLGWSGIVCKATLPPLVPGTDVIATLKVPEWVIVPRPLDLPATVKYQEGSKCVLQFQPFEAKVQKRFDAYVRRAIGAHRKLQSSQGGASALAEAFRMVQVSLDPLQSDRSRVLLVTSSVSGEGKTFLASGLAVLLAKDGHRVLLVDADLYRPSLHQTFGLPAVDGIARMLAAGDRANLKDLIQEPRCGLSVVTGGSDGTPSELYAESSVSALLSDLRGSGFDIVIMDSPPLLEAAGAIPLARAADDVLMAVRSGRSRQRDVLQSRTLLERNGVQLRGVILNDYSGLDQTSYANGYALTQADLE